MLPAKKAVNPITNWHFMICKVIGLPTIALDGDFGQTRGTGNKGSNTGPGDSGTNGSSNGEALHHDGSYKNRNDDDDDDDYRWMVYQ